MRPFEKEVERRYSAGGGRLISQHINSMLDAAYRNSHQPVVRVLVDLSPVGLLGSRTVIFCSPRISFYPFYYFLVVINQVTYHYILAV